MDQLESPELLATWIEAARTGDTEAITKIYRLFAPDLFRFAMTIVRNPDIAEDVASESFLRAFGHLSSFKGGNFKAFLYTIARNYAYDTLRKNGRTTTLTDANEPTGANDEVLHTVVTNEETRSILTALATLPSDQRDVLTLRYIESFSVRETADMLGKSEIAVRVIQCRALKALKKKLL